jgi:Putative Ig domain
VIERSLTLIPRMALAILIAAFCLLAISCSGGAAKNLPIQIEFTSPVNGPTIEQGQSANFLVKVVNDSANEGVTWSLQTTHGQPVGMLSNMTATSATYTAPASITEQTQVSVVATSASDMISSATMAVIMNPPPQITSASPISTPCPAAGTVINGFGAAPYAFGWIVGRNGVWDLTATGGVSPYTWTLNAGTLPAGLSIGVDPVSNQPAIVGSPTSNSCANVTIQMTDAAGVSVSASYNLLVLPPPLSVQAPPLPTAYVGLPYAPSALKASGGVTPYTWAPDSNPAAAFPPGLVANSASQNPDIAVITGTPTADGLNQQNNSPALYVYDSQLPYPATAHPVLTLGAGQVLNADSSCHTGSEASLSAEAPYAFLLRGFDANGPVVIVGNFTVDGAGNITSGVEDINRSSGSQTSLGILAGSSYTLGLVNRGCLTLANSAGTTLTFRTAFGACSTTANTGVGGNCQNNGYFMRGRILIDDSATGIRATGIIRLQDSTTFTNSGLSGTYAFGLSGWDASGGRYAVAGSASASAGNFNSVAADINDAGALGSNLTGGSGTYSIASSGRGTATISAGSASYSMAVYPVSGGEAILATTDTLDGAHPILSGEALSAASSLTVASLQNTYMLRMTGLSSSEADANLGLLTFDGLSAVSGTIYENNGGTLGTTAISANYAIDGGTGRLLLSAPQQNQNLGAHPIVAYVASTTSGVSGFLVSTDASAQAGVLEFQIQNPPLTTFSNASLQGASFTGTDEMLDTNTTNYIGTGIFNGNGGFGGVGVVLDTSYPAASGAFPSPHGLLPNGQFAYSYSVGKNGVGIFGGQTVSITNGTTVFSLDESPLDLSPAVTVTEQ